MTLHDRISKKIIGRLTLTIAESDLLSKYASIEGNHLEIGCLWGGSAILSALSKANGHVYTVDFMQGGFWLTGDPGANRNVPTLKAVQQNIKAFDLEDRITLIVSNSNPLPDVNPVTVMIDGDHSFEGCMADWLNVKSLNPDYVLFHDYKTGNHPGVERVVDHVRDYEENWHQVDIADSMIVFERLGR